MKFTPRKNEKTCFLLQNSRQIDKKTSKKNTSVIKKSHINAGKNID